MTRTYERDGIRLQYPETWEVEEETYTEGWSATFQSEGAAFAVLSMHPGEHQPDAIASQILDSLREDYTDLEAEPALQTIAGRPAVGHDIEFFSMDFPIVCWTRCLNVSGGAIMLMCQTSDPERGDAEPFLKELCDSVTVDDEV